MKKLLLSAALLLGLIAPASAQKVVQQTISGNEVWVAAQGPGGTGRYIGINTVRNGQAFAITSGSGSATSTAAGGVLMWIGTAPTTWTVTTPAVPFDGEEIQLTTDTTLTSMVTLTAASGQSLHATYSAQTLTALTPVIFYYHAANTTWYRVQ